ncbi:hypothetical protein LSI54_04145 [Nesterenkonia sp. AY15]|uniref:hypothetical protein n=1 Tax=Nesterenkonia sp. AY15 TaxID=2901139 RepID=UPI001F4CEC09|nr:hypothetical protein [Nesterenkonia sp. AY15]MCH8570553.1 hypothetical protein [Nesterenkonia sp. AY15]
MHKTVVAGTGFLAALALISCAGASEESVEPSEASASMPTVTAEPEPEQSPATDAPEDAWLAEARDSYLDDLEEWHREYSGAGCVAHEPQCRDLFAEGLPLMADYSYWVRNQTEGLPEYVPASYSADLAAATRALVSWSYACPDDEDCAEIAQDAESRSFEVITATSDWAAK